MHAAHPLRVTLSQVIIDGHHMAALALKRIEVSGKHTGQGLTLTGLHLGDVAEVQRSAAHNLDRVMLLPQHTPGCFTSRGECLKQQIVDSFTALEALFELVRLSGKFGVT